MALSAIEHAIASVPRTEDPDGATVDDRVVSAAGRVGAVISNDQVIGRRAKNLGARWLRTADLVVLAVRSGRIEVGRGTTAIHSLLAAGRITETLRDAYVRELS